MEEKKSNGKKYIEITAKGCSTVARFYQPDFGTYINELPKAFYDAYTSYAKDGETLEDEGVKKEK